ncbi:probable ubiquitin carboxyl-terminal hydrolase MINDY-4 [Actinia tenebrosa]|uniref:Ubiquitin carboxyl-terminal hydrolase MINDY n=1 Tax=Actinia tenebrosa TaxID=6105 RepID=A0A6P8HQ25_ACTTE|nr:probable ubiquitin carboxyl-terminal hydrolase MINDY-4 [Actinia tenebrosa]XP_031554775.1 probable ubiquitin carboxyl-terminal hydrolase MINDY-4 [Actinia tenebrosa]
MMSKHNFQTRSGVLEKWSKVFERSQPPSLPRSLPYRETVTRTDLELEDVFEEVSEEVNSKASKQITSMKSSQENSLIPLNRRRSRELVRPKTPGRLGLYQESALPSKKPPWQSSTKVERRQSAQYKHNSSQNGQAQYESSNFEATTNRPPITVKDANSPKPLIERTPFNASDPPPMEHTKSSRSGTLARSGTPTRSGTPARSGTPIRSGTPARPGTPTRSGTPARTGTPRSVTLKKPASARSVTAVIPVKHVSGGEPISQRTARELREVLFGSALTSFNTDWRSQHINFLGNSSYGLSFYKPGPCGLMACIQAFLMKYLLFYQNTNDLKGSVLDPLPSERQQALVSAIARMIWQAGYESNGVVALPCGTCNWRMTKEYREDDLTENLVIFRFNNLTELERFIKRNLSFFENTSGNGCIIFLYSVILSRTIKGIYTDLGSFDSILMENNETCSQSMLNLLLTGRAVSHLFNGDVEYDKRGNALPVPLKGIKTRSDIGYLTLKEHLKPKEIQVGSMLKTPKYPIWVVDSTGGRYGVIFCLNSELVNDWKLERLFKLNFYNGTSKYSSSCDEIVTVDTRDVVDESDITEDTHPVEHIIRTKWPGAVIEWD